MSGKLWLGRRTVGCLFFGLVWSAALLLSGQETVPANGQPRLSPEERTPEWASTAVYYQIFPERFRNGDPANDPGRASLETGQEIPGNWAITPWTADWYRHAEWERALGEDFYGPAVFHRRYGGDLQGVLDQLDYLADLGVTCLYFNPVFQARSLHKYDGNSFHHIDPHFGPDPEGDLQLIAAETADPASWNWTSADRLFLQLVREAHARKMRIIVDGVFNHTGRDFFAFDDIRQRGAASPYVDWYTIRQFDDPATSADEFEYACWWGVRTLPEFADSADGRDLHPGPRDYILACTRRWMDPDGDGNPVDGIDGWRLDVANEVPTGFWQAWNQEVRKLNRDACTIAEIWEGAGDFLDTCGFSSTMNYHAFAFPVKGFLIDGRMTASEFASTVEARMAEHPERVRLALQNLIDSHDTDRLASMIAHARSAGFRERPYLQPAKADYDVGERVSPRSFPDYPVTAPDRTGRTIQRLVSLFQFTFPGAPMIYYGTEAGMIGADDPDDRMPMVWPDLVYEPREFGPRGRLERAEPVAFDQELHAWYRGLARLRRDSEILQKGEFRFVAIGDPQQALAFSRSLGGRGILVAINRSETAARLEWSGAEGAAWSAAQLEMVLSVADGPPGSGPELRAAADDSGIGILLPPLSGAVWQTR